MTSDMDSLQILSFIFTLLYLILDSFTKEFQNPWFWNGYVIWLGMKYYFVKYKISNVFLWWTNVASNLDINFVTVDLSILINFDINFVEVSPCRRDWRTNEIANKDFRTKKTLKDIWFIFSYLWSPLLDHYFFASPWNEYSQKI